MAIRVDNIVTDEDGVEFEVIWDGGELLAGRETKKAPAEPVVQQGDKRRYNRTGKHVGEYNKWHPKPKCRVRLAAQQDGVTCMAGTKGCVVEHDPETIRGKVQRLDNIRQALDSLVQRAVHGESALSGD